MSLLESERKEMKPLASSHFTIMLLSTLTCFSFLCYLAKLFNIWHKAKSSSTFFLVIAAVPLQRVRLQHNTLRICLQHWPSWANWCHNQSARSVQPSSRVLRVWMVTLRKPEAKPNFLSKWKRSSWSLHCKGDILDLSIIILVKFKWAFVLKTRHTYYHFKSPGML